MYRCVALVGSRNLDLLVRVADGMSLCKTRTEETISSHYRQKPGPGTANRSQIDPDPDQKSPLRDRICRILDVFECLKADLGLMHKYTKVPLEPGRKSPQHTSIERVFHLFGDVSEVISDIPSTAHRILGITSPEITSEIGRAHV